MAGPLFAGAPAAVIRSDFVCPYTVELAIVRKGQRGNLTVMDSNGIVKLKVKGRFFSSRRELLDATGNTLITLKPKIFSMHDRWEAFRGRSTNSRNLVFTVKRAKLIQWKTKLHVMLRGNEGSGRTHDYKVKGAWSKKSCAVYAGNSDMMVAQMQKKESFKNWLTGKKHFMVTVYPNVDYAFIASIIAILNVIKSKSGGDGGDGGGDGGGGACGGGCGGGCGG